jgi:molybdopterin converting factor small subunit
MPVSAPAIQVELFGMARRRAGHSEFASSGTTIGQVLDELTRACPNLSDLFLEVGRLSPRYLVSIDAGPFLTSLNHPLKPGDRLLLLSADAGG